MQTGIYPDVFTAQVRNRSFYFTSDQNIFLPGFQIGRKIPDIITVNSRVGKIHFHFYLGIEIGKIIKTLKTHGEEIPQMALAGEEFEIVKLHTLRVKLNIRAELFN